VACRAVGTRVGYVRQLVAACVTPDAFENGGSHRRPDLETHRCRPPISEGREPPNGSRLSCGRPARRRKGAGRQFVPARAQHSDSLKAITARQLQALVRPQPSYAISREVPSSRARSSGIQYDNRPGVNPSTGLSLSKWRSLPPVSSCSRMRCAARSVRK